MSAPRRSAAAESGNAGQSGRTVDVLQSGAGGGMPGAK
jgi:hypothetical protein